MEEPSLEEGLAIHKIPPIGNKINNNL